MYNDEVVQFRGGISEYVGRVKELKERGKGWYRIKEPCLVFQRDNPAMKRRENVLAYLPGPQQNFKKFIDVYIPPDSIIEVWPLDEAGELYKVYQKEISREAPSLIVVPTMGMAAPN